MPFSEAVLVVDHNLRNLCAHPYCNHLRGCPNYGKRDTCPPKAPYIEEFLDLTKPTFIIWNVFDLIPHLEKMGRLHPNWTDRQKRCCLYWQTRARSRLRDWIDVFQYQYPGLCVTTCPEAMGVNVSETMSKIGEKLQWPPETKTYQVAIAGSSPLSS